MKYYTEVEYEEHMLFAHEIATAYNLFDEAGKPNALLVANIIKKYIKKYTIPCRQLFYNTRFGLKRVYPYIIYTKALDEYLRGES